MKSIDILGNLKMYGNLRDDGMEHDLWYDSDGTLSSWEVTFHGLGFKSYDYAGGQHLLDDAEYTWFLMRFS